MGTATPKELALMALTTTSIFCDCYMILLVSLTFRRHSGLYFWTLIGTTMAQISVSISVYLTYWIIPTTLPGIPLALNSTGNTFYVLFEFLVLYSRLHLLGASKRHLEMILGLIMGEWILVEIPLAIVGIYSSLRPEKVLLATVRDRLLDVESVLYVMVDCGLSAMYFFLIKRMWGEEKAWRRVYWNIIVMMILILCIDITYLVFAYLNSNEITLGVVLLAFSFKVPIEIYALNMLTDMSKAEHETTHNQFGAAALDHLPHMNHGNGNTTMTTMTTVTSNSGPSRLPEITLPS